MTGHQVWTTLHANDAVTIPFRLRDLDVEHYKIGDPSLLTGLISQRLLRLLCTDCCRTVSENEFSPVMLARLEAARIPVERLRKRNTISPIANNHGAAASLRVALTRQPQPLDDDSVFIAGTEAAPP